MAVRGPRPPEHYDDRDREYRSSRREYRERDRDASYDERERRFAAVSKLIADYDADDGYFLPEIDKRMMPNSSRGPPRRYASESTRRYSRPRVYEETDYSKDYYAYDSSIASSRYNPPKTNGPLVPKLKIAVGGYDPVNDSGSYYTGYKAGAKGYAKGSKRAPRRRGGPQTERGPPRRKPQKGGKTLKIKKTKTDKKQEHFHDNWKEQALRYMKVGHKKPKKPEKKKHLHIVGTPIAHLLGVYFIPKRKINKDRQGLIIKDIVPAGRAFLAGLKVGDVVEAVDHIHITCMQSFEEALLSIPDTKDHVRVKVRRPVVSGIETNSDKIVIDEKSFGGDSLPGCISEAQEEYEVERELMKNKHGEKVFLKDMSLITLSIPSLAERKQVVEEDFVHEDKLARWKRRPGVETRRRRLQLWSASAKRNGLALDDKAARAEIFGNLPVEFGGKPPPTEDAVKSDGKSKKLKTKRGPPAPQNKKAHKASNHAQKAAYELCKKHLRYARSLDGSAIHPDGKPTMYAQVVMDFTKHAEDRLALMRRLNRGRDDLSKFEKRREDAVTAAKKLKSTIENNVQIVTLAMQNCNEMIKKLDSVEVMGWGSLPSPPTILRKILSAVYVLVVHTSAWNSDVTDLRASRQKQWKLCRSVLLSDFDGLLEDLDLVTKTDLDIEVVKFARAELDRDEAYMEAASNEVMMSLGVWMPAKVTKEIMGFVTPDLIDEEACMQVDKTTAAMFEWVESVIERGVALHEILECVQNQRVYEDTVNECDRMNISLSGPQGDVQLMTQELNMMNEECLRQIILIDLLSTRHEDLVLGDRMRDGGGGKLTIKAASLVQADLNAQADTKKSGKGKKGKKIDEKKEKQKDTKKLLKDAGLEEHFERFVADDIDVATLLICDDDTLKLVLPKLGDFLRLKAKLDDLKGHPSLENPPEPPKVVKKEKKKYEPPPLDPNRPLDYGDEVWAVWEDGFAYKALINNIVGEEWEEVKWYSVLFPEFCEEYGLIRKENIFRHEPSEEECLRALPAKRKKKKPKPKPKPPPKKNYKISTQQLKAARGRWDVDGILAGDIIPTCIQRSQENYRLKGGRFEKAPPPKRVMGCLDEHAPDHRPPQKIVFLTHAEIFKMTAPPDIIGQAQQEWMKGKTPEEVAEIERRDKEADEAAVAKRKENAKNPKKKPKKKKKAPKPKDEFVAPKMEEVFKTHEEILKMTAMPSVITSRQALWEEGKTPEEIAAIEAKDKEDLQNLERERQRRINQHLVEERDAVEKVIAFLTSDKCAIFDIVEGDNFDMDEEDVYEMIHMCATPHATIKLIKKINSHGFKCFSLDELLVAMEHELKGNGTKHREEAKKKLEKAKLEDETAEDLVLEYLMSEDCIIFAEAGEELQISETMILSVIHLCDGGSGCLEVLKQINAKGKGMPDFETLKKEVETEMADTIEERKRKKEEAKKRNAERRALKLADAMYEPDMDLIGSLDMPGGDSPPKVILGDEVYAKMDAEKKEKAKVTRKNTEQRQKTKWEAEQREEEERALKAMEAKIAADKEIAGAEDKEIKEIATKRRKAKEEEERKKREAQEAIERKEREAREEKERVEREVREEKERKEREAKEEAERKEREAKEEAERKEREAKEEAERKEREAREAKEAAERKEREAKEEAEKEKAEETKTEGQEADGEADTKADTEAEEKKRKEDEEYGDAAVEWLRGFFTTNAKLFEKPEGLEFKDEQLRELLKLGQGKESLEEELGDLIEEDQAFEDVTEIIALIQQSKEFEQNLRKYLSGKGSKLVPGVEITEEAVDFFMQTGRDYEEIEKTLDKLVSQKKTFESHEAISKVVAEELDGLEHKVDDVADYLTSPECHMFDGAVNGLEATESDIVQLIEKGGPNVMEVLTKLDVKKRNFSRISHLIKVVGEFKAANEAGDAKAVEEVIKGEDVINQNEEAIDKIIDFLSDDQCLLFSDDAELELDEDLLEDMITVVGDGKEAIRRIEALNKSGREFDSIQEVIEAVKTFKE